MDIASTVRSGELSPAEVVEGAIARIEAANPELACVVIPLFERARDQLAAIGMSACGASTVTRSTHRPDGQAVET